MYTGFETITRNGLIDCVHMWAARASFQAFEHPKSHGRHEKFGSRLTGYQIDESCLTELGRFLGVTGIEGKTYFIGIVAQ